MTMTQAEWVLKFANVKSVKELINLYNACECLTCMYRKENGYMLFRAGPACTVAN